MTFIALYSAEGSFIKNETKWEEKQRGRGGRREEREKGIGASFFSSLFPLSPAPLQAPLVISLSPVPYLSPLERERGLCGEESVY